MSRVKGGSVARNRRKKILNLAKGYYGSKHILFRTAQEQVMKSYTYEYRDRKKRKGDFRKLWIIRINAAARLSNLSYSKLIFALKKGKININRKMLADLAVNDTSAFSSLMEEAKNILGNS